MKNRSVISILAVSQFVMILDSTVMNVSISTVAKDLGTTISGMQAAITLYALTMAAFMLLGGKLGDKWGRSKAFKYGSIIYGIGSLITALSPSLPVLLIGWSLIEGLGAILVIPAIAALAAVNYSGKERLKAFAILGAVTGLAAAFGPVIGGYVTTYFSWRYVFAAETLIMIGVLLVSNKIYDTKPDSTTKIDIPSAALSASGMALLVFGALQSKSWGWISPLATPEIGGQAVAPLGISLVAYLILAGVAVLRLFISRQKKLERENKNPLLSVSLLKIPVLRSGLAVLLSQYFTIAAIFFVIPVYLQTILGYDALQTGLKLLPLSVGLIVFTIIGSRLTKSRATRRIVRTGQTLLALGSLLLLGSIDPSLNSTLFMFGLFVVGAGFGLLASQLGNVNMSAAPKDSTSEVGGLQGTYQNLGTSFGTAVAGSVFMLILTAGFTAGIADSSLSAQTKETITQQASTGVAIVSKDQAEQYLLKAGASESVASEATTVYEEAQIESLKKAMFVIFAVVLLSLLFSSNLPSTLGEKSGRQKH